MKNIEDMYALSPLQEGLLFHTVAEPSSSAYHQQMVLTLNGKLDHQALQQAWSNTIARHAVLRASYVWENLEAPLQVIQSLQQQAQTSLSIEDWRDQSLSEDAVEQKLIQRVDGERRDPFSLLKAPLMRLLLIQTNEEEYYFIWTYHHLIIDGWSSTLLLSELLTAYSALSKGSKPQLNEPENYRRYIAWLQQQDQQQAQNYWQKELEGWQGCTPLPLTFKGKDVDSLAVDNNLNYGEQTLELDQVLSEQLHRFIRDQRITLNTLAQAAWACVLQRHSNTDDVLFGATTHGRPPQLDGSEQMVGLFINTLPLRVQLDSEQSAADLLQQLQQQNSDMRQFDYIPPAQLRQWCQTESNDQLFQSILVFENFPVDKALADASIADNTLQAELYDTSKPCLQNEDYVDGAIIHSGRNHFPLTLVWHPGERPQIAISYQLEHYSHQAAQLLLQQYHCVLQELVNKAAQPIAKLQLSQKNSNDDIAISGEQQSITDIVDLFVQQVKANSNEIAVVDEKKQLTYQELNTTTNRLARYLNQQLPDQPAGTVVALCCDRSTDLIVGILAALKASFSYLAIDPSLPDARIQSLLSDSDAKFLLTTQDEQPQLSQTVPNMLLDQDGVLNDYSDADLQAGNYCDETLAYLVYTSGSTGEPKGVMIPRRAISNYVAGFLARHENDLGQQVASMATVAADLGNTQIYAALCSGKTLHMLSHDCMHNPDAAAEYMTQHRIDSLKIVPSHLQGLLSASEAAKVLPQKTLILGGEGASQQLLQKLQQLAPNMTIINHYGPSETTVGITTDQRCTNEDYFPLGRPLANTDLYILDRNLQPVAIGERGELYVGGPALAHGYYGQADQTTEAFIPNPFARGDSDYQQCLYKTGDAVRQLADGRLLYLGRVDSQVKIRGYRVEPLELENRLRTLCAGHGVKELAVAALDATTGEGKRLVAYIVPDNNDTQSNDSLQQSLQQLLAEQLPDYLLPSAWVFMEQLPLNANGKLDRKQLPLPSDDKKTDGKKAGTVAEKVLPRNPVEQALADIWQEVLNSQDDIGVHDDFFSLGGDSILNLQIIARANRQGIKLTPKQLFEHKTIAEIAAVADVQNSDLAGNDLALGKPLTSAQRYWLHHHKPEQLGNWRLLHCERLDLAKLKQAASAIIKNHPVLRSQFTQDDKGQWQCTEQGAEQALAFTTLPLEANDDVLSQAEQWKAEFSFNSLQEPLLRWFAVTDSSADTSVIALLVQAHPLILDNSQWNDLLDNLHGFYRDPEDNARVESVQYSDWAEVLAEVETQAAPDNTIHSESVQDITQQLSQLSIPKDLAKALKRQRLNWHQLATTACVQAMQQSQDSEKFSLALLASSRPQTLFDCPVMDYAEHECFGDNRYSRVIGCFEQPMLIQWPQLDDNVLNALQQTKEYLYQQFRAGTVVTQSQKKPDVVLKVSEPIAITTEYFKEQQRLNAAPYSLANTLQRGTALEIQVIAGKTSLQVLWQGCTDVISAEQLSRLQTLFDEKLTRLLQAIVDAPSSTPLLTDFPLLAINKEASNNKASNSEADHKITLTNLELDWSQVEDIYPLSPMQEGLLLHTLLRPNSGIYLMQQYYHWQGDLNPKLLVQAWEMMLQRYPVLRTGFYWQGEQRPLQVVYHKQDNPVQFFDWRDKNREQQQVAMEALLTEERAQGFDMQNGPLTRLRVVRTDDQRYDIMRSFHHVLTDAWCFSLLMVDFMAYYEALLADQTIYLSPPRPYRDYIAWLERQDKAAAEHFWQDYLAGFATPTPLPLEKSASEKDDAYGIDNEQIAFLSKEETQQLTNLAQQFQITPNTFLQGAWIYLLSYYSGDRDILVGVTTSGRPTDMEGVENIFGLFINSLPLRIDVDPNTSLQSWMQQLLAENIKTRQYEYAPLVDIHRLSDIPKGEELFQSLIVFENAPIDASLDDERDDFNVERGKDRVHTNYPITVVGYPGDELGVRLSYETQKFSANSVSRMLTHLMTLLRQIIAKPAQNLGELNPLHDSEQQQLLQQWPQSEQDLPVNETFIQHFEAQVVQHSNTSAACCGDLALTYNELNQRANRVAHALRERGVQTDQHIALHGPRNLDYLVMILGVLKSGAAYVPLDIQHPPQRWQQIIRQSQAAFVITDGQVEASDLITENERNTALELLTLSELLTHTNTENPVSVTTPQHLAYVIYTSGSTGNPKGVMVHHQGMLNNILGKQPALDISADDVIAQTASPCFDISVWQFLAALVFGARVEILVDDIAKDPYRLADTVNQRGISLLEVVPALMPGLMEAQQDFSSLRWLLPTGEALPTTLSQAWFSHYPQVPLMNAYGPAECSDDVAFYPLHQAPPSADSAVAIGRPTANNRLYVLNAQQQPVPVGVVGEIAIAGTGVGRGYLDDPRRTAASFIPNPFVDHSHEQNNGERLYLSGDLGRWREDGILEYVGRRDQQVKIRGHRIELGEIEAVLEQLPNIQRAVVLTGTDSRGDQQLLAYVESQVADTEVIKAQLAERLPVYMVPQAMAVLDVLPLNANGKVDRKALSTKALPDLELGATSAYEAPATELEQQLAEIWQELLGCDQVGRQDNFFQLGGHSLLVTQVLARLRQQLQVELPLKTVFESSTIAALAQAIEAAESSDSNDLATIPRVSRQQPLPLSYAQQRLWFLDQLEGGSAAYNMPTAVKLSGTLNIDAVKAAVNTLLQRHESLRTRFGIEGDLPRQYIVNDCAIKVPINDLSQLSDIEQTQAVQRLIDEEAAQPFDLAKAPLLRVSLLKLTEQNHILQFTLHHITADAWSMGVLIEEFVHCYQAYSHGQQPLLAELPIQYGDYAHWQRSEPQQLQQARDIDYWRQKLKGAPMQIKLPLDKERPQQADYCGSSLTHTLAPAQVEALKAYGQSQQATLFMVLLNAFNHVLQRASGENDFMVGTDIANREHYSLESLIGFFVNVLPLRAQLNGADNFNQRLAALRETTLDAYQHQQVPFDKLVEVLQPERTPGVNPLVQVLFVMQNTPTMHVTLDELEVELMSAQHENSKFDIAVFVEEDTDGTASVRWLYRTSLFDSTTIAELNQGFQSLLDMVIAAPELSLDQWSWQLKNSTQKDSALNTEQETANQSARKAERKKSKMGKLKRAKAKAVSQVPEEQIKTSTFGTAADSQTAGSALPLIIEPKLTELDPMTWAEQSRPWIEQQLKNHGGLLFRGFNLPDAAVFEQFAQAIEPSLYGLYGDLPKNKSGKNIYHSTPYPEQQMILFHNESSHMAKWPRKQWFYCETPSEQGGCTPIVDCRQVYQQLPQDMISKLESKGLLYVRHFTDKLDVKWQDFFKTDDPREVEAQCLQSGMRWEWYKESGSSQDSLLTEQFCPAVIKHPYTGEKSFFNQVQLHHESCLEPEVRQNLHSLFGADKLPRNVYYGDGSVIEDEVMDEIGRVYEACAVRFQWQKGDMVMLDNMLVAHARDPYVGRRKICVAMGQMIQRNELEIQVQATTQETETA